MHRCECVVISLSYKSFICRFGWKDFPSYYKYIHSRAIFVLEKGGVLLLGTVLLLGHIRYMNDLNFGYIYIKIRKNLKKIPGTCWLLMLCVRFPDLRRGGLLPCMISLGGSTLLPPVFKAKTTWLGCFLAYSFSMGLFQALALVFVRIW